MDDLKHNWQVGLSAGKITPEEPMPMAGYAHRTELSEGVNRDLMLKAIAFEDGEGVRAVLINAEMLGFGEDEAGEICRRIGAETGLGREAILLNPSHTHSGPVCIKQYGGVGSGTPDMIGRYVDRVIDVAVVTAVDALSDMHPAQLSWGQGVVNFVMNRREFTDRGVRLGVNPRGLVDRSVPVLRVAGEDGKLMAVLFGAAGHNVTNDSRWMQIDGDYSGYAQRYLEAETGAQAMFVLGCAGDANTYPKGSNEWAKQHGETLGQEVCRVLEDDLAPVQGRLRLAFERVDLPLQQFESREAVEEMAKSAERFQQFFVDGALEVFNRGETLPTTFNAPFAMWQFGEDLTLVGLCGEILVDYVLLTEQTIGPLQLWVAGYCNSLFGYLPSPHVLEEGGYETRGLYLGVGLFTPEAYGIVGETIKRLAIQVGRPGVSETGNA